MELTFYWSNTPGYKAHDCWGQLADGANRLQVITTELEHLWEEEDLSTALSRLAYHIENYIVRIYELRERAISLTGEITSKPSTAGKLKSPKERPAAMLSLEPDFPAEMQALSALLNALDEDILLRNQHTHHEYLLLGLSTDSDIFDPQDVLIDLKSQPEAKARVEGIIRSEIERWIQDYVGKIETVSDAAWKFLDQAERHIKL